MDLIIKPTSRCNFACSFCSAGDLDILHLDHVPDQLKQLLSSLKPTRIIITGGDPLCTSLSFYQELLSLGDWSISLTTNLKAFIQDPDHWAPFFKDPRVGVCTSFQYGGQRRWDKETEYDEEMFRKTFSLFKNKVGHPLMFISVISSENEHLAMKHLELARSLKTKCKLNGMMKLGKSSESYPLYKMVQIWLKAFELGYEDCLDIETSLFHGGCNLNINGLCSTTIRSVMFTKDGKMRLTSCEDDLLDNSIQSLTDTSRPIPKPEDISLSDLVSDKCMFCELFRLCNSCHQYRKANKQTENHCEEMLKLKDKILESRWKIQ